MPAELDRMKVEALTADLLHAVKGHYQRNMPPSREHALEAINAIAIVAAAVVKNCGQDGLQFFDLAFKQQMMGFQGFIAGDRNENDGIG